MSEKIYLKIDQRRFVKKPKVTIGDVMTVYCSDKDMIEKIGHITLAEFTLGKYDRKVFDALDVIFYDHFAGQKLSKAPTPLEVEMDKYDKDISESVIDREGGK